MSGDLDRFHAAMEQVERLWIWREAFRSLKGVCAAEPIQRSFLALYQEGGDSLRSKVNDDSVLVPALKSLLPPYEGPDLKIYRGAHKNEWRYRSYGHAWTTDIEVAYSHASKDFHNGNGVVLQADAPAISIVSALALASADWHESEVVVDRRNLRDISVLRQIWRSRPLC